MTALDGLLRDQSTAASTDGSVIVGIWEVEDPEHRSRYEAYRWTAATGMLRMGDLPGGDLASSATDVSGDGAIIVGAGHRGEVSESQEAFRWTAATGMVGLGDLPGGFDSSSAFAISNDGRVIVGAGNSAFGVEAVRWTDEGGIESLRPLSTDGGGSSANDVNGDGSVIVGINWVASRAAGEAFRWTQQSGMVGLGDLSGGAFFSEATAVSADGSVIVGTSETDFGESDLDRRDAFIWDAAHGMRNLRELLISDYGLADELALWRLNFATGISADGRTIVGTGVNPNGEMEGWIARLDATAVPEPSTIALLAGGIVTAAAATFANRRRA